MDRFCPHIAYTAFRWTKLHGSFRVNKPAFINDYYQTDIDYSDHNMINVELNIKIPKAKEVTTASRDYRKLRSNQYFFLKKLAKIEWD